MVRYWKRSFDCKWRSIKFKSDVGQEQQNVVADYFDNGDIAGIYSRNQEVLWMNL